MSAGLCFVFVLNNEALIELCNVDVAFDGATVLRDVSWSLHGGQHWLIRGGNGSGKSTFLRLLRGEVWPMPKGGDRIYRLDGSTQLTAIEVRPHIALVSPEVQERYLQQEWRMTGRDVIETGFAQTDMLYVKLSRAQKTRAEGVSRELGITPLLERDMQSLSTGELRKLLVCRAVVGRPRVLLLDEVCDGLDAHFRGGLLRMIEVIASNGTQIIYTTHRDDEVLSVITHVAEFENGHLRQAKWSALAASAKRSREAKPVDLLRRTGPKAAEHSAPLIDIGNADVFLDGQKVLHGIDWKLRRGEHWVVLGSNGAGKTTFLKLIASDLYPVFGSRVQRFEFTADNTIWDLRRRIGCVSPLLQTHYCEQITAEQVVASGFFSSVGLMDNPTRMQLRTVRRLMRSFGLDHLRHEQMNRLSFGERRKMLTLRALVHDPDLLILDEPFDGLDVVSKREFAAALEEVANRGTQLIIVTHHLDDLPHCMTHGLFLERGRIVVAGEWARTRDHVQVKRLFGARPGSELR